MHIDIIGDVHGCFDELYELLIKLGYQVDINVNSYTVSHLSNRKIIFLGDLVDRGPKIVEVLKIASDAAICVCGNHDDKLRRKLRGNPVIIRDGLEETLRQIEERSAQFKEHIMFFLDGMDSHYMLDNGKLVVSHAGIKEEYIGVNTEKARQFCLYGDVRSDINGSRFRYDWAQDYRGKAMIVYGHTPILEPKWVNNTINIDTGCVFGGRLTALRYPEKELVSVQAKQQYYKHKGANS